MQTKQLSSNEIYELKNRIIEERLRSLFSKNPKKIAKVFEHLIKRSKKNG